MIRQEIIEKISSYFNLPQFEAENIYYEIFSMIMQGVKEESIVELIDFGEFILRDSAGALSRPLLSEDLSENKKTVEFLSNTKLEDAIGRGTYEIPKTISVQAPVVEQISIPDEKEKEIPASSIEDEMKRKREELLQKISIHPLQDAASHKDKPIIEEQPVIQTQQIPTVQEPYSQHEENLPLTGTAKEEVPASLESEEKPVEGLLQGEEDLSKKSFSDYFAVVGKETVPKEEPEPETILEPQPDQVQSSQINAPSVIPQTAIDLHNEIVGTPVDTEKAETVKAEESQTVVTPMGDVIPEKKVEDNSYYIWYKDSEATPSETQTLSYEYELLYQATKEAEYKSKLKIYVSSFILFFSLVLVLLIFSPVIYKFLFNPVEYPITEVAQQDNNAPEQNVTPNESQTTPPTEQQNTSGTDTSGKLVTQTNVNQQPQQQTETKPTEQPQQQTQQTSESNETKIEGVTRNALGWVDDKYKVMYIKLDNGKFTIQESSFDSDSKASKRMNDVEAYKIEGLKGTSVKTDLGVKGTWYRVRFGEFQTIEEARSKAQELRNKVKI